MIKAKSLSIGYDKELFKCSFDIPKKELITLIGRNGAGKSTLLKTIACLQEPLSGLIGYRIDPVKDLSVILSDPIDIQYLQVHELVSLGRFPYSNFWGNLRKEDLKKVDQVLEQLHLESYKTRYFNELSDGLKRRCLLAKALVKEPKLLLLDEPFVYLDPPSKDSIAKILKEIVEEREISVIISTHDWDVARKNFEKVWAITLNSELIVSDFESCEKKVSEIYPSDFV